MIHHIVGMARPKRFELLTPRFVFEGRCARARSFAHRGGTLRKGSLPKGKRRLPGARSSKRAGSAVELPGRRRRRATRRTRRSVSIAPQKAGRGTDCARPELSVRRYLRRPASGIVTKKGGDASGLWGSRGSMRRLG